MAEKAEENRHIERLITVNSLELPHGSDSWTQVYLDDELFWEGDDFGDFAFGYSPNLQDLLEVLGHKVEFAHYEPGDDYAIATQLRLDEESGYAKTREEEEFARTITFNIPADMTGEYRRAMVRFLGTFPKEGQHDTQATGQE